MTALEKPYHLLVADDDPAFRETLRQVLEPYFRLIEASSGEEAVRIGERQRIDIALLDMHMDVLTGLEALRILKSIHTVAPCILITGDPSDELERRASDADAYTVLSKPLSKSDLVTTVSTALEFAYEDPDAFSFPVNRFKIGPDRP